MRGVFAVSGLGCVMLGWSRRSGAGELGQVQRCYACGLARFKPLTGRVRRADGGDGGGVVR